MLTFALPWAFLLLPLPWLVRALVPPRRISRVSVRIPFGERLKDALRRSGGAQTTKKATQRWFVPILVWLLLLTALARPQWLLPPISKEQPTRDLLLLVDLSTSMEQRDFTNDTGETVDRLTAVQEVLDHFLQQREGDNIGLVVFGDSPFLQCPFSTDLNLIEQLLNETAIGMAGPRTALGDAIGMGIALFDHSDAPAKTIIALTDGNDTASKVPPIEAARIAEQRGIRLYTVAIGDPTTAGEDALDEKTLKTAAETTGGKYYFAGDRQQLEGIYDELNRIETKEIAVISHQPRRDLFPWAVLAALTLSLIDKMVSTIALRHKPGEKLVSQSRVRVDPVTGKLEVVE
ncbi:MAG: VWA domain-containing protein [Verrucomicrobiales bacterium]